MIVIELLACATEYFSMLFLLAAFFPLRNNKLRVRISTLIICGVIHIFLSMFPNNWPLLPKMILILVNWSVASKICFSGRTWKQALISLLFWAVAFTVDISILTACVTIMKWTSEMALSNDASYLLSILASRSLLLSISFGCAYIVRNQKRKLVKNGIRGIYLLFIPLYTIAGTGGLISNTIANGVELSGGVLFFSGGLLVINIVLCIILNKLERSRESEEEAQKLRAEAIHNLEAARNYQESFNQQRRITHEFHNQLDTIHSLLANKEYTRATNYVQHLQHTTQEIIPTIRTNHPIVDAILNQKYAQATQKGVGMLLCCNDLSKIPLEDGDMVTLLGNILDNAIAASAQSEEKYVWVRLWQERGVYQLIVRNSCLETPLTRDLRERLYHGYGVSLVNAVLDKYNYPYSCNRNGTVYIFSALLG